MKLPENTGLTKLVVQVNIKTTTPVASAVGCEASSEASAFSGI